MCLRVNRRLLSRDEYLQKLSNAGIIAEPCRFTDYGLRLQQAVDVYLLPGFADGEVSVQDEAAQLAAGLLQLESGQRILDACCAPGGKTCHLLESEPELTELVAIDSDAKRLQRVGDNLQRLSLQATLTVGDARSTGDWWDEQAFDRILLDAPCSATGVIRRNPDIKIHRKASDIEQLTRLQLEILESLWPTLARGGLLLYATCSVLPEENEANIATFCQRHTEATHLPITAEWGVSRPYGRQLFPQVSGHDGFYYALIKKNH